MRESRLFIHLNYVLSAFTRFTVERKYEVGVDGIPMLKFKLCHLSASASLLPAWLRKDGCGMAGALSSAYLVVGEMLARVDREHVHQFLLSRLLASRAFIPSECIHLHSEGEREELLPVRSQIAAELSGLTFS